MTPTPASAGATGGAAVSEHLPAPGRYRRKRPTEVEAIQWTGRNFADVKAFGSGAVGIGPVEGGALPLWVVKSSATCRVERGDWIIRERDGSGFYPCNADVFAAIYEPAGGTGDQPDPALPVAAALEGDSERPGGAGPSVDTPQALPTPPDSARDDLGASSSLAAALDPDALGEILHRARQAAGARRDRPMRPADWAERDERLKAVDVEMAQAVADAVSAAYENAISWDTSCLACAGTLDSAYTETVRREQAEAKLAALRTRCRDVMSGYPLLPFVPAMDILRITGSDDDGVDFNRLASERNAIGQVIRCALSWAMAGMPLDPEAVRELLVGGILRPWSGLPEERGEEGTKP
jgi:hypothetical protein